MNMKKALIYLFLILTSFNYTSNSHAGLSGEQYLELNRYTLELIYHFYSEDSVYQGGSVFECNKLEKKI